MIPVRFQGERRIFVHSMYLDDEAPIAGGREIWGFPQKLVRPNFAMRARCLSARCISARCSAPWAAWVISTRIGTADDHSGADGSGILDFFLAQRKVRKIAAEAKAPAASGDFTVACAMDAYFARLELEGSISLTVARGTARRHILPKLGATVVGDLARERLLNGLQEWLRRPLTAIPARTLPARPQGYREPHPNYPARSFESGIP
jgi:hypothetical protein